jgi:nucleotide-binding universal stress UspA family protein
MMALTTKGRAMFSRIVWATDGSEAADVALPHVRELASAVSAAVVVVHVEEHMVGPRAYGLDVNVDEEDLKTKIRNQAAELEAAGLTVETDFVAGRYGVAAHVISETAEQHGADLIALGTRGHTPLRGLMLGSVTERLLKIAPCPVLAVPAR